MKEFAIPMSEDARQKKGARLRRLCSACSVLTVTFAVCAVLMLLAVLGAVIAAEFVHDASRLCFILAGAFGGGTVCFVALTVLFERLSSATDARTLDYFERCDGEESFFVGDGTLASFRETGMLIHGEKRELFVPYADIGFYSVCTRRRPREKGEWFVVFGIPARYFSKAQKDAPPLYVQTELKPRLTRALEAHSIALSGEKAEEGPKKAKFGLEKKFYLPNRKKRKSALLFLAGGGVLLAAGVAVIWFQQAVGSALIVLGALLAARAVVGLLRARALFAVYREGIFWRESEGRDSVFLKWGELLRLRRDEENGLPVIIAELPYGTYHFPRAAGAFEFLEEHHGEDVACGN